MNKKVLWLLLSNLNCKEIHLIMPSLAWMAKEAGAEFECYLEAPREGVLFATTGSTVLGGHHHQQFNYLNSVYNVKYIIYGDAKLFNSSIEVFNCETIINTSSIKDLYDTVLLYAGIKATPDFSVFPVTFSKPDGEELNISAYVYPEIYYRKTLGIPWNQRELFAEKLETANNVFGLYLSEDELAKVKQYNLQVQEIDQLRMEDTFGTVTLRLAQRWKQKAKSLAFGDPDAILSQITSLCRDESVAVFGEIHRLKANEIKVTQYADEMSEIATQVSALAEEIGNRYIVGRQTGDGDLFEWSKKGVSIKIMDPNRPAFPIVQSIKHKWADTKSSIYDLEPDDALLRSYAEQGKILATLIFHSGEMAHNEAMLNLFDMINFTGLKVGMGVHAARYETCPQLWELMNVPRENGGVKGFAEPVLYSGGMGILAEVNTPGKLLTEDCKKSLEIIREISGEKNAPKGFMSFMDADLSTLEPGDVSVYEAVKAGGLDYMISCARPGRNQLIYEKDDFLVMNQTPRIVYHASPYLRVSTMEELSEAPKVSPGWIIGVLDAPVTSFSPYIWRYGSRFMKIVDWLLNGQSICSVMPNTSMKSNENIINATPNTIARYARILKEKGVIPKL